MSKTRNFRSIATKSVGVLLGATALCTIGAGAAFADTPSAPPAPMYSRGFHLYNLTSTPLTLTSITGDRNFEGAPAVGSVLQPGQYADFEVQWQYFSEQNDNITYSTADGANTMQVGLTVHSGGGGEAVSHIEGHTGRDIISDPGNGTTIYFEEPPGTTITYDGAQAQQQATVLKQLCDTNADAKCTFAAKTETKVNIPKRQIGDGFNNASKVKADYTLAEHDTVGISDSVDISASTSVKLFDMVDEQINVAFQHQWTKTHEFDESIDAHVPPMTRVWLDDAPGMIRDTGDFTVTVGNTTINLPGVYFDSPDPAGNGNWTLESQPITGGPIQSTPLH